MGEVAALSAAFEIETNKVLASLPAISSCPPWEHDAHLNHHRVTQKLSELIAYYTSRLPPYVCLGRILSIGDRLCKQGEHQLALEACYIPLQQMNVHLQTDVARMDESTRLSCHIQASFGIAACEAALALSADPRIKHPDTLQILVVSLQRFKEALTLVLPHEQLYWLTLNGTVHIYNLSKTLLAAGFVSHMLPFLLFCVKALDQHVTSSTAKYLPWRTQLYSTLCYAYCDAKSYDLAKQVVEDGVARIEALIKLQKLDPVPAPPEIQAAYRTAKALLCALKLKIEVQSAPNNPPPAAPPPTDKKAAAAAAALQSDSGLAALQPLISELSYNSKLKLTAMLEALQRPGCRVVRHQSVYGVMKELFNAVLSEATPLINALSKALTTVPDVGDTGKAASPGVTIITTGEGSTATEATHINPPEAEEFSLVLHRALLCTAFNFEQQPTVQQLLQLAHQRLAAVAVGKADDATVSSFSAIVKVLEAVGLLESEPGTNTIRRVSHTLLEVQGVMKSCGPDMLADASLALHTAAKHLLEGVQGNQFMKGFDLSALMQDQGSELATDVLRALHACWEAVSLDDGLLRVSTALKLALLLEGQAAEARDVLLYEAQDVLKAAKAAVVTCRCEASATHRGAADESVQWISSSRNQPSEEHATHMQGMTDTESELACLHTDVLAALFRVELAVGVAEQKAQAQSKQAKLIESVTKREAQSNIFGIRTMKEKRLDEDRVTLAGVTPANPSMKERELLAQCGKNGYEKAIALMQMAAFHADQHRQMTMLTEAADLLAKAQEREDATFASAVPADRTKASTPLQPKILQRTPTSLSLTNFTFNLKGGKRVARYAVYAKSYGAGVALILNKTASEYPGTGVRVAPGSRITVDGLKTNDTYVFAIAAYDEAGNLIGELGTSSVEILAGLPLPLYYCWSHLLLTACKLQLWSLAKRASRVLFPHFINATPDRPLWEANPMRAQRLQTAHVQAAAAPLLRAFVQCVYAYTGVMLNADLAAAQASASGDAKGRAPPLAEVRAPYLEEQVARLVNVQRLILGMEVSVILGEEMLAQEGAVRVYHLLGPLLAVKQKTPMLLAALGAVHVALQHVSNLVQDSLVGQEVQRKAATRVACGMILHASTLAARAGETNVTSHLAGLHLELLKAYDARCSIPGRPNEKQQTLPEIGALQDALLNQTNAPDWSTANPSGILAKRMADESDLAARALPLIASTNPMSAWTTYLGKEEAVQDPRWVELVARMLEACLLRGQHESIGAIAEQVQWQVQLALAYPQINFPGPRWRLRAAVSAITGVVLDASEELPKPQVDGLTTEEATIVQTQWASARDAAVMHKTERIAAITLLQQRLPVLLVRKRAIDTARVKAKQWLPWLSRLAAIVGMVEANKGRLEAAAKEQAQLPDMAMEPGRDGVVERPVTPTTPNGGTRSGAASPTRASPNKTAAAAAKSGAGTPKGGKGGKVGADTAAPAQPAPSAGVPSSLIALQNLARAAQLASRAHAWHEVLNVTRHTWNVSRALLNTDTSLMQPVPPVTWEPGASMPNAATPPVSMLQPTGKDNKPGKKEPAKKEDPKAKESKDAKGGKKGAAADAAAVQERVWPPIWAAKGSVLNVGRVLRSSAEALLYMVSCLRQGDLLCTGVLPLGTATGSETSTSSPNAVGSRGAGKELRARPTTQASVAYASSHFSYGSDLQVDRWFQQDTSLNMDWVNRVIVMILTALHKMQRWHAIIAIGSQWLQLCEGHYNEQVLPLLLAAAPHAGADVAPFKSAMEAVIRDKNAAMTALAKVRSLVREKLGDVTPLNQPVHGGQLRKKRRAAPQPTNRPGAGSQYLVSSSGNITADDASSLVSAYTMATHSSNRTAGTQQPDFIRIPAEYEKAMEVLKQRGEEGAFILATAELGDVHAHFGNWAAAITAWNDALDTLIGPYQVIKSWRKVLDPMSDQAVLQAYGLHGCLFAGGILLGKLARYAYYSQLGLRLEAARMSAALLKAIFRADAVHPQRAAGFAAYVPRELWQGVDVFADPYRCNLTDLLSGLETVVGILVDAGLALEALPVCALWEHVAYLVTRNLGSTVLCRIQRVHACVQLGLMQEAASLLAGLMQGSYLPDPCLHVDLVVKDTQGKAVQITQVTPFNAAALPGDPSNQPITQLVADGPLHPALAQLYGDWAVARLALARAAFLQGLAKVPNLWTATNPLTGKRNTVSDVATPAVEEALLEKASALIERAKGIAQGLALEPEVAPGSPAKAGSKQPAQPTATKEKKDTNAKGARPMSPDPGQGTSGDQSMVTKMKAGLNNISPTTAAQRAEVAVRTLLCECQQELLRLRPQAALQATLEALRLMGDLGNDLDHANLSVQGLNLPLGDNDDTERFSLGPGLWLQAQLQAAQCTFQLRNMNACQELLTKALEDASAVSDNCTVAALLHVRAQVYQMTGNTKQAIETYRDVIARYQVLQVSDMRAAQALLDCARLKDQIGLRQDSNRLFNSALNLSRSLACAIGLSEAKENPELINLYATGFALYADVLERSAMCAVRQRRLDTAIELLEESLIVLQKHSRTTPAQLAAVTLMLGRCLRLQMFLSDPGLHSSASSRQSSIISTKSPAEVMQQLQRAQELLISSYTLAAVDGGHQRHIMREALLELASIYVQGASATQAVACLRHAHDVAVRQNVLMLSNHILTPLNVSQMPSWAREFVSGQEQGFASSQGKGGSTAAVSDAEVGRLLVCCFIAWFRCLFSLPTAEIQRAHVCITTLHTALKVACPKYTADACMPDITLPPLATPSQPTTTDSSKSDTRDKAAQAANAAMQAATAMAPGTVVVQWAIQDGCWQEPASFINDGTLAPVKPGDADVLALRPVPTYAAMLYVVVTQTGKVCVGERVYEVASVRAMQTQVRSLSHRSEQPRGPNDLFGHPAPSLTELHLLRRAVERFILGQRLSEDGQMHEPPVLIAQPVEQPQAPAISSPRSKGSNAKSAPATQQPAKPVGPSPTDVAFLTKLEAMLNVEGGLELVDLGFAEFMAQVLP